MKYQSPYRELTHDGAAVCERLDKLIEQQEALLIGLQHDADWRREMAGYPRSVRIEGSR